MRFIPSLELSRMLYEEEIAPTIAREFPELRYAAATLGMCSEVLGLDDEVSMDHEWGPRITLFLSEADHSRTGDALMSTLRASLPMTFQGFDMMWRRPGVDVHDTRHSILYHVWTSTVSDALRFCGGREALPLKPRDWLGISEQHLLEFTSGVVYRDDVGELSEARALLEYYPDDVLRFLLMCEWTALGGDWFPIGRMGSRGDSLGLRIQAAKVAQRLMRIAFMVSRQYFTYKKWFGTLFKRLPIAALLEPVLMELLQEADWRKVEERIGEAAQVLMAQQNRLGFVPSVMMRPKRAMNGRHHLDFDFWGIGRRTAQNLPLELQSLVDNQVFWLHERQLILWNEEVGKWSLLLQK